MLSGRNTSMRHMGRTHCVCVAWLHERINDGSISVQYCKTNDMLADIFTKAFTDKVKWRQLCEMINLFQGDQWGNLHSATPAYSPLPPKRTLVEVCCGHDSVLGQDSSETQRCRKIRITVDDDFTSRAGLNKTLHEIEGPNTLVWASLPCTGGSPWQHLNKRHAKARAKNS